MGAAVRITLPYPPSVNAYWRHVRGRTLLSADARAYKVAVGQQCNLLGIVPTSAPVVLRINVYRPRAQGDLDNILKALLDSLAGHAYVDDAQVVELHAWRHDDRAVPRVEVEVECKP